MPTRICLRGPPTRFHLPRSEEHTSELQSHVNLVCRLLLEKKKIDYNSCSPLPVISAPLTCTLCCVTPPIRGPREDVCSWFRYPLGRGWCIECTVLCSGLTR